MTLAVGSTLGPYEILGQIGAGGMGEVYRAKDPRLGRDVAIKVLPASFSQDADRLRRFEQEAKAAGVLNHPNITAVYDIGTDASDGAPYVVQELLEGETLRSLLAGGRLAQRKTIDYALQIAKGLAAAHDKGIVHRDLKPENLFVTRDGRVKILDFGLAKLTQLEGSSSIATNLPTETKGTEPGVVLGTLGYMAPEQVRGKPADPRSDIFSFGAILYEMLSGKRAFHGDTAADTMSAILKEDPPDLSVTNQNVSPGLERIVRHCLEKSPEQRFHSAHDLAFDLEALSTASGTPSAIGGVKAARGPLARVPVLAAAAAVVLGALLGHFLWKPAKPAAPSYRRLTFRHGNVGIARFAPDGRTVVYSASWEGQPLEIYTTHAEGPESTSLGIRNANLYAVSSLGELAISVRQGFLTGPGGVGTLATVPMGGGAPRSIAEYVEDASWTPDGKQLGVLRFLEGRYRIELPLGKVVYSTDVHELARLRVSPSGNRLAFLESRNASRALVSVDLAGKSTALVPEGIHGQGLAWTPSGDEVWFDDQGAQGQFAIEAADLSGRVRTVATLPVGMVVHDIARDGRVLIERYASQRGILVLAPGAARERDLSWFDGSRLAGLSDDGRRMLINETGDATGRSGVYYLRGTDGSPAVKLGEGRAMDLSPDGQWVLGSPPDADRTYVLAPTGTGTPVTLDERPFFQSVLLAKFFPDGKRLLLLAAEPGKERRLYVQELPSGKPSLITPRLNGLEGRPVSSDGRWIAGYLEYAEDVQIVPVAGGESRTVPNTKGDFQFIRWSPDGRSLIGVVNGSLPARLLRVDIATGSREVIKELAPPELSGIVEISRICMTPDLASYAYGYGKSATSDLYVVEGWK